MSNAQQAVSLRSITPSNLNQLVEQGVQVEVIDVRTPAEYRSMHATIARCQPLDTIDPHRVMQSRRLPGQPLYVICRSGQRSARACSAFEAAGYGDLVVNVEGGTLAWSSAGLPIARGRYILPLDRQVQTVVGIMVLLSCGLGAFVNPWWYLLAAYCGLGLEIAGLTGYCPLGKLLARMPWNQAEVENPGTCCA